MRKRPSIAIATCSGHWLAKAADAPLLEALRAAGAQASPAEWTDPTVDWASFDACLVRSTWDWHYQPQRFREWVQRVGRATRLLNPSALLEWSLDKRYLADLSGRGVPCVPTRFVPANDKAAIEQAVSLSGAATCVIKPTLGATGFRVAMIDSAYSVAQWLRDNEGVEGMVGVQPFIETITTLGETSLIYIEGEFSHAVKKVPRQGDFRVQADFGGSSGLIGCTPKERALGDLCMARLPEPALYARIDMVRLPGGDPGVMECELVEPELFFNLHEPSAARLANATLRRLGATAA